MCYQLRRSSCAVLSTSQVVCYGLHYSRCLLCSHTFSNDRLNLHIKFSIFLLYLTDLVLYYVIILCVSFGEFLFVGCTCSFRYILFIHELLSNSSDALGHQWHDYLVLVAPFSRPPCQTSVYCVGVVTRSADDIDFVHSLLTWVFHYVCVSVCF